MAFAATVKPSIPVRLFASSLGLGVLTLSVPALAQHHGGHHGGYGHHGGGHGFYGGHGGGHGFYGGYRGGRRFYGGYGGYGSGRGFYRGHGGRHHGGGVGFH